MTTQSGPAAALWGRIMNQIPQVKEGSYKDMPSNVIRKGSEYYTKGTEPDRVESDSGDSEKSSAQRRREAEALFED